MTAKPTLPIVRIVRDGDSEPVTSAAPATEAADEPLKTIAEATKSPGRPRYRIVSFYSEAYHTVAFKAQRRWWWTPFWISFAGVHSTEAEAHDAINIDKGIRRRNAEAKAKAKDKAFKSTTYIED